MGAPSLYLTVALHRPPDAAFDKSWVGVPLEAPRVYPAKQSAGVQRTWAQPLPAKWLLEAFMGDAVSKCEDLGAIDEKVMDIVNIAKELEGEGFSYVIEDDIREHIEDCFEPFTSEELEELI
ncbi:hypothetical protein TTRE_0000831601 [Trichuris trichiura]|uniref:Uncharacterized protein n=1 Tax=Trichuris trichiura TaxID=36087 RepID=A0A077ZJQ7_TRITR|nr:hypothetical protein TTRE_0000831601 [Trichuris trichiura]